MSQKGSGEGMALGDAGGVGLDGYVLHHCTSICLILATDCCCLFMHGQHEMRIRHETALALQRERVEQTEIGRSWAGTDGSGAEVCGASLLGVPSRCPGPAV